MSALFPAGFAGMDAERFRDDADNCTAIADALVMWKAELDSACVAAKLDEASNTSDMVSDAAESLRRLATYMQLKAMQMELVDQGKFAEACALSLKVGVARVLLAWFERDEVERADGLVDAVLSPGDDTDDRASLVAQLENMSGAQVDQMVRGLSNDELEAFLDDVAQRFTPQERADILLVIGERVSINTWTRMGRFTEMIDPSLSTGAGDTASPTEIEASVFSDANYVNFIVANDVDPFDVKQGKLGDCYLIAALISVAIDDPNRVRDMVRINPNGMYTVTFADGTSQVVSPRFAWLPGSNRSDVLLASAADNQTTNLVSVIEKGFAQRYGLEGGYGEIEGGQAANAITELVGIPGTRTAVDPAAATTEDAVPTYDLIVEAVENGDIVSLSSLNKGDTLPDTYNTSDANGRVDKFERLHTGHAFVVGGVDVDNGTVNVINPWDSSKSLDLTAEQVQASFDAVYTNAQPESP